MTNNQNFVPHDHEDENQALQAETAASETATSETAAGETATGGAQVGADSGVAGTDDAVGTDGAVGAGGPVGTDGVAGTPDDGEQEAAGVLSELDTALLKVAKLEENLARRNADLYNLQQEYNNYVKRSKADGLVQYDNGIAKVLDTLLSVLDDAALARAHGDLDGPAGTIVDKLEQTLETNFQLVRYGTEGEEFDPELHDALMNQTSPDVETQQIAQLIQPGYRQGEKVIRPARVGVVSPE